MFVALFISWVAQGLSNVLIAYVNDSKNQSFLIYVYTK